MKVSLIQMNSVSDKPANIAAATRLIDEAVAEEGPDWICLPECFDFMGGDRAAKFAAAERLPDGPAYSAMQALAAKHRIFIHAGSILEKPEGGERLHNTTVAFGRDGAEIARYRKIHMFDVTTPDGAQYRESASFAPGEAIVTYPCEDIIVGCSICYDLRFPDLFQALAAKGAQMIALPAAFTQQTGKDHWEVLVPRPRHRDADLTSAPRRRPARMSPAMTGPREAPDLRPFAGRRPVGTCDRQGLGWRRHRLDPDRRRARRKGPRANSGGAAQGRLRIGLIRWPVRRGLRRAFLLAAALLAIASPAAMPK